MCFRVKYFASEWLLQCCYDRPVIKSKYFSVVETKVRPTKSWPRHYKSGGCWWCVLWALFRQHLGFWREVHLVRHPPPPSHTHWLIWWQWVVAGSRGVWGTVGDTYHCPMCWWPQLTWAESWSVVTSPITVQPPSSCSLQFRATAKESSLGWQPTVFPKSWVLTIFLQTICIYNCHNCLSQDATAWRLVFRLSLFLCLSLGHIGRMNGCRSSLYLYLHLYSVQCTCTCLQL